MAAPKYYLRSGDGLCSIYIDFTVSRALKMRTSTGLKINAQDWSSATGLPKQNRTENKNISSQLRKLASFIEDQYNVDFSNGAIFSNAWLKQKVNDFFGRLAVMEDDNLISVFIGNYNKTRELDYKTKPTSDRKFIQLQQKIEAFEKVKKRKFFIAEIDERFFLDFRKFIVAEFRLMESTANRTIKNLKTVLYKARQNGKEINYQVPNIIIGSVPAIKVFLSFEELDKIKAANLIGDDLMHARDWLIIGCYTGQRISDLMRMNTSLIFTKTDAEGNKYKFIEIVQDKTGKHITIPVHDEVERILERYSGNFPPTFGNSVASRNVLFNRYIKKVCEVAGINAPVKGVVYDDKTKRNIIADTFKFQLVSSHICRRSFATNFYGDKRFTTPQLMAITGHSTEGTFLLYIGKNSADHAMQTAKTFREISNAQKIS